MVAQRALGAAPVSEGQRTCKTFAVFKPFGYYDDFGESGCAFLLGGGKTMHVFFII